MAGLIEFQTQSLKSVIARLYDHNANYRAKMDAAKIRPTDFKSLADLQHFPFTRKEDLRNAYPFGYLTVPKDELVRVHTSSGSIGFATVSAYSRADIEAWSTMMAECLTDFGVTPADTVLITHGYGLFTGGLGVHYGAEKLGCLVVPSSSGQTLKLVELIRALGVTVIVGNPSYVLKLGAAMRAAKLPPEEVKLKLCICGAEPWGENLRREIESTLGIPALDLYGISEVIGPGVAAESALKQGALVVRENHFYPEVLDGELVISTLTKNAMPLLRYRTGDRTEWAPEFNGAYRAIRRISGRNDDLIKIKGIAVYPLQIEEVLLNEKNLNGNYVIELSRPAHVDVLTIRAEEKSPGAAKSAELAKLIRAHFGLSAEILILPAGSLPEQNGKTKRFFDLREGG